MISDALKSQYPQLWNKYLRAEGYVNSDPTACVLNMGPMAEYMAAQAICWYELRGIAGKQVERLELLKHSGVIPEKIYAIMDDIRLLRNKVGHELADAGALETQKVFGCMPELLAWFEGVWKEKVVAKRPDSKSDESAELQARRDFVEAELERKWFANLWGDDPDPERYDILVDKVAVLSFYKGYAVMNGEILVKTNNFLVNKKGFYLYDKVVQEVDFGMILSLNDDVKVRSAIDRGIAFYECDNSRHYVVSQGDDDVRERQEIFPLDLYPRKTMAILVEKNKATPESPQ